MTPAAASLKSILADHATREGVTVRMQGTCLTVKCWNLGLRQMPEVNRGVIRGFSRASRLRLFKLVNAIDWEKIMPSLFITLTYPDEVGECYIAQRTQHRYLFMRLLEKDAGYKVPGIWRCEWKTRRSGVNKGLIMPHVHYLLFGVRFIDHQKIRKWWRSVIHHEGPLATDVQKVTSGKQAGCYVAKYLAKVDTDRSLDIHAYLNNLGRQWGYLRKGLFPMMDVEFLNELKPEQLAWLFQAANEALPWLNANHKTSFVLFGERAKVIVKKLRDWYLTDAGQVQ
jgi:hypothetical protein